MNRRNIIITIFIVLIIIYLFNIKKENLDTSTLSNEAIQNIASVYASTTGTASFNNVKITGNLDAQNLKGIIVMWSGKLNLIPTGWVLCDGTNGTPDLRGKFVLGFGQGKDLTNRNMGESGGEETHKLIVDELPSHNHKIFTPIGSKQESWKFVKDQYYDQNGVVKTWSDVYGSARTVNYTNLGSNDNIYFTLPGTTSNVGLNKPHNIMPPYYVLAYIMKL